MKRTLSVLLAVLLLVSLSPVFPASADSPEVWDGTVDISWYDPAQSAYYLSTPAQLAGLAALVNGMADPECPEIIGNQSYLESVPVGDFLLVGAGGGNVSDVVYTSTVDFAYKTVYLTADMDMGGVYNAAAGTWSGPNWTPIGGKFPMLPREASGDCLTLDTRFNGVLDGQGHTVKNIYCDRYAAKGFPYSMAIGLVGFLGGTGGESYEVHGSAAVFENGWQPAVRNVVVGGGSILGRRMVGGVVGRIGQTSDGIIIENCANFAAVHSTDAKGVGGICGAAWGDGVIRGCYNAGTISTTYSSPAGGIAGTNEGVDIYCCYNIGTINTNGQARGRAIGSHDTGIYTVGNCLYLEGMADDPANPGYYVGNSKRISVSVTGMRAEELKSEAALQVLNTDGAVFAADVNGTNGGFPVLWYQNGANSGTFHVAVQQPAEGGTVRVKGGAESVTFGQTVTLESEPADGYALEYFTVNGARVSADCFTATGDSVVSAVFQRLRTVALTFPENADTAYLAVLREGGTPGGDYVSGEYLRNGDALLEGDILTVLAHGYEGMTPGDEALEYIDAFTLTLPGTVQNPDGSYTVTGETDVNITAERKTQKKSWLTLADTDWYLRAPRASTYTLTTPEQLAGLAYLVNREGNAFAGVTILLGDDISLANTDGSESARYWTAIGSNFNRSFQGVFDGQGHAVYDLTADSDGSYAGLFGCVKDAVIRNLSVYGSVTDRAASSYAAGVAAYVSGGRLENCANYAEIAASGTHAGGIAAMIRDGAVIENCFNNGKITAASGLGGIVGVSETGTDIITNCANFGAVISAGNAAYGTGGIAGRLAGVISGCVNYGAVSGTDRYTGGIAGYTTGRNTSAIYDSANRGAVSADNTMATAALGGVVGYAQYLTFANVENTGSVGGTAAHMGDLIGREGNEPVREVSSDGVIPAYEPDPPREFPDREHIGARPEPVSRPKLARGRDTLTENGTYYIGWFASGEIKIADGTGVTLRGTCGGEEGFEGLRISVGRGAKLTLENVILNGETTMLSFAGDNTLTLRGENEILNRADAQNNSQPAMRVSGNLTVDGDGGLYIEAGIRNAAVYVDVPGSTVELKGGRLSVYKEDLLGMEGGAVYANGSDIVVSGGELRGHTVSDNVAVISADGVTLTDGRVMAQAERSPLAVQAPVTAAGGSISASGHSGNSAAENMAYPGIEAVASYSGSVQFSGFLPFDDVFASNGYYDAVEFCYKNGYFKGTSDTAFSPDVSMTRAMFVTVLYRLAGQPEVIGESSFADLTQEWYQNAVAWAVDRGITNGVSDTEFSPDTPVTREQAAVFLYRYALSAGELDKPERTPYTGTHGSFSSWADVEAQWVLDAGLFDGAKNALSVPGAEAPRSLLATALENYVQALER